MNEGDELFPAIEFRKKKRGFGFRYLSKKMLKRFRLTRLAKSRGCEVTSITRILLYPSSIPSELCGRDIHRCVASS